MKSTTSKTQPTSSITSATLSKDYNTRTIDCSKIPYLSGYEDPESRINEAICLAALLKELVCPHWIRHPESPGSENILVPFDSTLLEKSAREGLGYIAGRIEDVLRECEQAIYCVGEVSK